MLRLAFGTTLVLITPILFAGLTTPAHFIWIVLLGARPSMLLAGLCLLMHFTLFKAGKLSNFSFLFPVVGFVCGFIGIYLEIQNADGGSFERNSSSILLWGIGGALAGYLFALCVYKNAPETTSEAL